MRIPGPLARFDRIDRWTTRGLVIEDVIAPAGTLLSGHGHDLPHLCFLVDGHFQERDRGRTLSVEPGMLRASPACDEHHIRFGSAGGRCLLLFVSPGLGDSADPPLPIERRFLRGESIVRIARQLSAQLAHPLADISPIAVESLGLELLAHATMPGQRRRRLFRGPPPWLRRIREALEYDEPMDLAQLASDAGRHPVHVARVFRHWYGAGPASFARSSRLERARRLLLESDQSVAAVAAEAGFADQAHLTRALRRRLGVTPVVLRRQRAGGLDVSRVQDNAAITASF